MPAPLRLRSLPGNPGDPAGQHNGRSKWSKRRHPLPEGANPYRKPDSVLVTVLLAILLLALVAAVSWIGSSFEIF